MPHEIHDTPLEKSSRRLPNPRLDAALSVIHASTVISAPRVFRFAKQAIAYSPTALSPGYFRYGGTIHPRLAIAIAALIYSKHFVACLRKINPVRRCAAAYKTRAKFLSRAAILEIAPTGLVTYSREAIKSPVVMDRSDALVHL